MKTSNLMIAIPEPCHEDWNKMQPNEKGKFCGSCNKPVFDFSNKTDTEIKNILIEHKDEKVCGHFRKTQINRPLNISIDLNDLPRNISTTKAFIIALFLVFGTLLFSCTDEKNKTVGEIEFVQPKPNENIITAIPITTLEPIPNIETVEGKVSCHVESYVNGGMRVEQIPAIEDSTIYKTIPAINDSSAMYHTLGMMVIETIPADTTTTDSIPLKNTATQIGDNVISRQTDLSVYPNPSTGEFTIKYDVIKRSDIQIDIYYIKGTHIRSIVNVPDQHSGKYQIPVSLNELEPGIYFVNLINNGKKFSEKVVIEK